MDEIARKDTILQEVLRRSAGNRDMRLIDMSDQRFPELFGQILEYITQWDGKEESLVAVTDRAAAGQTIAVLTRVLELQDAARRQRN
jgi:hypothetical protein